MPEFKMEKNDKWALPVFVGAGVLLGSIFRRSVFGALGGLIGYLIWKNSPAKNAHVKEQPPRP